MVLQQIQHKTYEIRGQKVMLDFDLAELYNTETRILNQSVKRNIERFPDDFMFQLKDYEWFNMSSQSVMTSKRPKASLPFVFTEHGVTMLSSVLKSKTAIEINIQIVRAFVAVRNLLTVPSVDNILNIQSQINELKNYLEEIFTDQNDINEDTRVQIEMIHQSLVELQQDRQNVNNKPRKRIGYTAEE